MIPLFITFSSHSLQQQTQNIIHDVSEALMTLQVLKGEQNHYQIH